MVNEAAITHVCQLYITPGHPVFNLVPGPLNVYLMECYNLLNWPSVTHATVWYIYLDLLYTIQESASSLPPLPMPAMIEETETAGSLPLIEGQHNLPFNINLIQVFIIFLGGKGGTQCLLTSHHNHHL